MRWTFMAIPSSGNPLVKTAARDRNPGGRLDGRNLGTGGTAPNTPSGTAERLNDGGWWPDADARRYGTVAYALHTVDAAF